MRTLAVAALFFGLGWGCATRCNGLWALAVEPITYRRQRRTA